MRKLYVLKYLISRWSLVSREFSNTENASWANPLPFFVMNSGPALFPRVARCSNIPETGGIQPYWWLLNKY